MPKRVEAALKRAGRKKGYKGDRLDNFVYGTMENMKKRKKKKGSMGRTI